MTKPMSPIVAQVALIRQALAAGTVTEYMLRHGPENLMLSVVGHGELAKAFAVLQPLVQQGIVTVGELAGDGWPRALDKGDPNLYRHE